MNADYNAGVQAERERITRKLEASLVNRTETTTEDGRTITTYFIEIDEPTCQSIKHGDE